MIGFFLGLAFRRYVKATPENAVKRHTIATLLGVVIGIYCFENEFYHLVFISVVSYLSLHFLPRSYVHLYVAQRVHNSFDDISNSNKISSFFKNYIRFCANLFELNSFVHTAIPLWPQAIRCYIVI